MVGKEFYVVNSFGTQPFGGNPAGVFLDTEDLDTDIMQSIARQLNVVATVFVFPSSQETADFELRYFMPGKEIPIGGHPTIAAWLALVHSNSIDLATRSIYHQQTGAGIQEIHLEKNEAGNVVVTMKQPSPQFLSCCDERETVADVFGIHPSDILEDVPIQAVDTGLGHLVFGVTSLEALMRVRRHIKPLHALCQKYGVHEAQIFSFETYDAMCDVHTRNIRPQEGLEDPACGVGTAALLASLMKHAFHGEHTVHVTAEQGHIVKMPSRIDAYGERSPDGALEIEIRGSGVVMIRGEIFF